MSRPAAVASWLGPPCGPRVLAFDADHVEPLAGLTCARLREQATGSAVTATRGHRVPYWVVGRRNRARTLAALARLRVRAAERRACARGPAAGFRSRR